MSDYASPFPVLPHTLNDADAKTLRAAVYTHFEKAAGEAESAGDEDATSNSLVLDRIGINDRLIKASTEPVVSIKQQLQESPQSGTDTSRTAKMGLFRWRSKRN